MSDPYVGQVIPVGFNFAPVGWQICDGTLLPIAEYTALFSLIGTSFGGDGLTNFAVPDLRGRVALGAGQGVGLQSYTIGQPGGSETVSLTSAQFAGHTHALSATAAAATTPTPGPGVVFGTSPAAEPLYASSGATAALSANTVSTAPGTAAPHENLQPYTTMTYIIALNGIFPPRS